jgi:hypothetical protein
VDYGRTAFHLDRAVFGITDEAVIARAFTASLLLEIHCCLADRRIDRVAACSLMTSKPFDQRTADEIADALYCFGGAESLLLECVEPEALAPWLRRFIEIHRGAREWSIGCNREFLSVQHA